MGLVVSSWVDSYRNSHAAGMIPMSIYDKVMRACVDLVLNRPGVKVFVACHPDIQITEGPRADLYGWIAVEYDIEVPQRTRERINGRNQWTEKLVPAGCPLVHYIYVKETYRRMGLARGLLAKAGLKPEDRFFFTCKTPVVSDLKLPNAKWQPLIARFPK